MFVCYFGSMSIRMGHKNERLNSLNNHFKFNWDQSVHWLRRSIVIYQILKVISENV